MVFGLSKGRKEPCLDGKGGNEKIYLAKWSKDINYSVQNDEIQTLSGLDFKLFESLDIATDLNLEHTDEGEFYSIDINFSMFQVDKETSQLMNALSDMFLVAVVFDAYGLGRVYGLKNGLSGSFPETSGGAKQSFSGYKIELKGEQTDKPYYIASDYFDTTDNLLGLFVSGRLIYVNNRAIILN